MSFFVWTDIKSDVADSPICRFIIRAEGSSMVPRRGESYSVFPFSLHVAGAIWVTLSGIVKGGRKNVPAKEFFEKIEQ